VVAQLGSDEILLYASDYPHHHENLAAMPGLDALPPDLVAKIKTVNPRAVYRL
jgi:hypothetical protein